MWSDHMMWWDNGGYGMFFGPLFMILALVATIAFIVLLVRWLSGAPGGNPFGVPAVPGRAPLDILRERFAKGEINKDEYEERRRVLES